jgi:hypothetical protein
MEQVHGAKEGSQAEAGGRAMNSPWKAEKKSILKKTRVQVQEGLDGKSGPARREFAYA